MKSSKYSILYHIYSILTSRYQNNDFFKKTAFESGLLVLKDILFSSSLCVSLFSAEPLYPNVRIDHGIIALLARFLLLMVKH